MITEKRITNNDNRKKNQTHIRIQNTITPVQTQVTKSSLSNLLFQNLKITKHPHKNNNNTIINISIHQCTMSHFATDSYSVGTHHRNLLKSLVFMSRVTFFIP